MPKQGKSELKALSALIRQLSLMACAGAKAAARPTDVESVQTPREQADSTIEHVVKQDFRVFKQRADVYRERRREVRVLRQPRETSRRGPPGPSCLRSVATQRDPQPPSTARAEKGSSTASSSSRSVRIEIGDAATSIGPEGGLRRLHSGALVGRVP